MNSPLRLAGKAAEKLRHEGLKRTLEKSASIIKGDVVSARHRKRNPEAFTFADVVFVNGCDYSVPHPVRYRVDHQIQQLEANGMSAAKVDAWDLTWEHLGGGRCFIFFRCPITPFIQEFIEKAQKLNKKVIFDIDDLVVDTRYTDAIEYVSALPAAEKELYDEGVHRMGATLRAAGSAITTTERLAIELGTLVPEVFVNRNTASEEMLDYSSRALFERDVLPNLPIEKVEPRDRQHWEWAQDHVRRRDNGDVVIGYFSGSITHNADFNMILPALIAVMEERPNVRLKVMGELDLPEALEPYADRIETAGFCAWQDLPYAIADADINIAPLQDTIFNEAKSENKWVEAALVKVPTIASDVGAFAKMIDSGHTGLLCSSTDEWCDALIRLVDHPEERERIALAAHDFCVDECTTIMAGHRLAKYLRAVMNPNVFMLLPSLHTSGGLNVALRHCCLLQDAGFDVCLVDDSGETKDATFEFEGHSFLVIPASSSRNKDVKILLRGRIDIAIATMWTTVSLFDKYANIAKRMYLVQGFETKFYEPPTPLRSLANATYSRQDVDYLTISKWCKSWLAERFEKQADYVPNGIDRDLFYFAERSNYQGRKIRILIEGDSGSYYKNIDEAFRVVDQLDPDVYEIWYVSYSGEPKSTYRVDRFFHELTQEQMADLYRECDILLKTSILESFAYPPLEMMSTGGFVVAILNDGNAEYLLPEENCLIYEQGNCDDAVKQIERIVNDDELRARLVEGGKVTAESRDWKNIGSRIVAAYRK